MAFWRRRPSAAENDPLRVKVEAALTEARAYARSHGGDLQLLDVSSDGVVTLRLRGACAMCPLSTVTIKVAVERRLKELVPEVARVVAKT